MILNGHIQVTTILFNFVYLYTVKKSKNPRLNNNNQRKLGNFFNWVQNTLFKHGFLFKFTANMLVLGQQ